MQVLITGSTGFLGWRILERLVNDPLVDSIIATGRTLLPSHCVIHEKVKYVLGDLSDEIFVQQLLPGIDVVIHAAGLSSPWGNFNEFNQANYVPITHILKHGEANGLKRIIFISTPSVYFEIKDKLDIKEADPLPKKLWNAYAQTKRNAEIALENANIPYVIFRPRSIIGRGDRVIFPRVIAAADSGKLKVIGNAENLVDLTPVSNVVDAVVLALTAEGEALNQTYNLSNGEPIPLWMVINKLLRALGKKTPRKKVPFWIAIYTANLLEWISKRTTNTEPTLTRYAVAILGKSFSLNIHKAKSLLGYQPKQTTEDAVSEFVEWYTDLE